MNSSDWHSRNKPAQVECEEQVNLSLQRSRSLVIDRQGVPPCRPVVSVKPLTSSAKAEDLCDDKLLPGDVVEQVSVGSMILNAPFAGRKAGLQRELRRFYSIGETSVEVGVRRLRKKSVKLQVCIVPDDSVMLKKQYALRAIHDTNHVVTFMDSTEEACIAIQEMRCARVVSQLTTTPLKDGYASYPWEQKMEQQLRSQRNSIVFSILFVPYAPARDRALPSHNNVDDTVARAMTWLTAAQVSGIPISFLSIQTEPLLTKVSGQQASKCTVSASSWEDLSSVTNTGIYGFEDYHGIDIGVVRAVRLWYVPSVAEIAVLLKPDEGESRLGVSICRTDEGFCCVSSVETGTVADRAGLKMLHRAATSAGKLLVISRVEEEKIAPTMVSSAGSVRCYDTISISQKLAMHRRAGQRVRIHVMAWEEGGGVSVPDPEEDGGDAADLRWRTRDEEAEDNYYGEESGGAGRREDYEYWDERRRVAERWPSKRCATVEHGVDEHEQGQERQKGGGQPPCAGGDGRRVASQPAQLDRTGSFSFRIISDLRISNLSLTKD